MPDYELPAQPEPVCVVCNGAGFLRYDVPVGHPLFGKIVPCECRADEIQRKHAERLVALSGLRPAMRRMTFDAYVTGNDPTLVTALDAATQFAANPRGWLYLHGGYGCGKTHLLSAIAWTLIDRGIGAFYVVVPDLIAKLKATFDGGDEAFADRFERIKTADVVLLDDLGAERATPWVQEQMFELVNSRYLSELPLVVASNLSPEQIGGRVGSRLDDRFLVDRVPMLARDYRRGTA